MHRITLVIGLLNCPFTINVHDHACSHPQEGVNYMARRNLRVSVGRDENVLCFTRPSVPDSGAAALDLVYEAAEIFRDMEDHARETEARAQSLCKSALERLRLAETRAEAAERERRELTTEAECKLQDASRALKQAQSRIEAAEDRLPGHGSFPEGDRVRRTLQSACAPSAHIGPIARAQGKPNARSAFGSALHGRRV
jgi:hypothetical protein